VVPLVGDELVEGVRLKQRDSAADRTGVRRCAATRSWPPTIPASVRGLSGDPWPWRSVVGKIDHVDPFKSTAGC
jgi:hypothetical protein